MEHSTARSSMSLCAGSSSGMADEQRPFCTSEADVKQPSSLARIWGISDQHLIFTRGDEHNARIEPLGFVHCHDVHSVWNDGLFLFFCEEQ